MNEYYKSMKCYYSIFNLPKPSSLEQLKFAYKTILKQSAETKDSMKIQEIRETYNILSDPIQKEVYDTLGFHGLDEYKHMYLPSNGFNYGCLGFGGGCFGTHFYHREIDKIIQKHKPSIPDPIPDPNPSPKSESDNNGETNDDQPFKMDSSCKQM